MLDLATEREHLAKADRDIAEGEARISHQVELIERLREGGHSVSDAERLLTTLQQTLETWQNHREEILRTIARLERGELGSPGGSPVPPT
jgi:flagellar motility protein MotE (MotC chaperone)